MKKLLLFLMSAVVLAGLFTYMPRDLVAVLDKTVGDAYVTIYCTEYSGESIETGIGKAVTVPINSYARTVVRCGDIRGVTVTFNGNLRDVQSILDSLDAVTLSSERLKNIVTVYAYSPSVCGKLIVDGQPVNIQIAFTNGVVHVGSPLLLGSY